MDHIKAIYWLCRGFLGNLCQSCEINYVSYTRDTQATDVRIALNVPRQLMFI